MLGMSNYLINKVVDWFHRGQAYAPPATVYLELCSTAPAAGTPGTPLSGTGYARQAIDSSLVNWSGTQADGSVDASSGTSGVTSNNGPIDFGTAAAAWGAVSHWETYDAPSGGNRLLFGEIVNSLRVAAPRTVNLGDPVSFSAGALRVQWG